MARRGKKGGPAFVLIYHWMMGTAAWRDLSSGAIATYLELKRRYNGKNNGTIGLGSRGAGEAVGKSKSTAARYLLELEAHGFIKRNKISSFNQKRLTVEWCLTEFRDDSTGEMASKLFASWTKEQGLKRKAGAPVPHAGTRPIAPALRADPHGVGAAKIQKPVPSMNSAVPLGGLSAHLMSNSGQSGPSSGTVLGVSSGSQSHRWDTSTSVPEGAPSEYVLKLAASIRVYLTAAYGLKPSDDDRRVMRLAAAVASKAERDGKRNEVLVDPLVSSILSAFPGSTTNWDHHLLPGYLEGVASDGPLLN